MPARAIRELPGFPAVLCPGVSTLPAQLLRKGLPQPHSPCCPVTQQIPFPHLYFYAALWDRNLSLALCPGHDASSRLAPRT